MSNVLVVATENLLRHEYSYQLAAITIGNEVQTFTHQCAILDYQTISMVTLPKLLDLLYLFGLGKSNPTCLNPNETKLSMKKKIIIKRTSKIMSPWDHHRATRSMR